MKPDCTTQLLTVGEIARRLHEPIHRVEYAIRARDIQPQGWAGNARVFCEGDVEYIAWLLRADEEEGPGKQGGAS